MTITFATEMSYIKCVTNKSKKNKNQKAFVKKKIIKYA